MTDRQQILTELREASRAYEAEKQGAPALVKSMVARRVAAAKQRRDNAARAARLADVSLRSIAAELGRKNVQAAKNAIENGRANETDG